MAAVVLIVSLATLFGSAYGLGKESYDTSSSTYKAAFIFTILSSIVTAIATFFTIYGVYKSVCNPQILQKTIDRTQELMQKLKS